MWSALHTSSTTGPGTKELGSPFLVLERPKDKKHFLLGAPSLCSGKGSAISLKLLLLAGQLCLDRAQCSEVRQGWAYLRGTLVSSFCGGG